MNADKLLMLAEDDLTTVRQQFETQRQLNAENEKLRAESRKLRVETGESDAEGARQLALDVGDLPEELFADISGRDDLTPDTPVSSGSLPREDTDQLKAVSDQRRQAEETRFPWN